MILNGKYLYLKLRNKFDNCFVYTCFILVAEWYENSYWISLDMCNILVSKEKDCLPIKFGCQSDENAKY